MQTVRLLFVIFFLAIAPAVAENPWLDEAPRDAGDETNAHSASSKTLQPIVVEPTTVETMTVEPTTVQSTNAYVLPAASIPDAPTP